MIHLSQTSQAPSEDAELTSKEIISMEEFCDRFVGMMTERASHTTFPNGCAVLDYATEAAPAYWMQASLRIMGPEHCVISDMRHCHEAWGDPA